LQQQFTFQVVFNKNAVMEETKTNAGQGLGIAGLILGIIAIPLAILGCTSILGLVLGIAGVILSAVGLSQATKSNGTKGLPTAGLVVSILGTAIALMWLLFFTRIAHEGTKWWGREGIHIMEDLNEEFGDEIEEAFEDIGKELEELGEELENKLEDLEWAEDWEDFEWGEEITDEEFQKVMDTYESLIQDYGNLIEEANQGDINALAEYAKVSVKAVALATKITAISPRLTDEQKEKFEKLQQKYEKALKEAEDTQ
jgi:enamine deaminase RidA (YjgF/YER057c/UK114 family)